MGMAHFTLRQA
jgi:hypothetical protein